MSLCGRLKLIKKKHRNQISEMTQERSSPEFAGVRRSSSEFVGVRRGSSGPNLLRENAVAKVEKLVIKMRFYFLRAVFPCFLGAKTSKHT